MSSQDEHGGHTSVYTFRIGHRYFFFNSDTVAYVPLQFLRCPIRVLLKMIDGMDRLI